MRYLLQLLLMLIPSAADAWVVAVTWNANVEPVAGYLVSWGTESGKYDRQVDVRNVTSWTVVPHSQTSRVFLTVQAYNAAGWSPPSAELTVLPLTSPTPTPTGTATTTTTTTIAPLVRPKTPSGVKAIAVPE